MNRFRPTFCFIAVIFFVAAVQSTGYADIESEIRAHKQDVAKYDAEVTKYNGALKLYDKELRAYESEVKWHNNLPATKRTDFQYRRLIRWKAELDSRYNKLNSMHADLEAWRKRINDRVRRLSQAR